MQQKRLLPTTERTARGDLIYSHSLYKALQEELVALLAPRVKPLHIDLINHLM